MSKRNIGIRFSDEFGVDADWLRENQIFDPTLDVDTQLFIDPFLLPYSSHPEISNDAFEAYEVHFASIFSLLNASRTTGDKAWRTAKKKFQFSESKGMSGTCIGYSRSTSGRAFGEIKSQQALTWAKEIIDFGVKDPELFSALGLFEDGIGADLISDMVLSITIDQVLAFNKKILGKVRAELDIKIPTAEYELAGRTAFLPANPTSPQGHPVILLPSDILKHLPAIDDPRSIGDLSEFNDGLRERVNAHLSTLAEASMKKDKKAILDEAESNPEAFQTFLDALKMLEKDPYNFTSDPKGLLNWRETALKYANSYPLQLIVDPSLSRIDQIDSVCITIIEKFTENIEVRRLSRDLYEGGKPKNEAFAQRIFMVIAEAYCDANDIDISPESDRGAGPVDFKFSRGLDKITVEIKLSTNSSLVKGYTKQLEAYTEAERAAKGHYVVIDVGRMGKKWEKLQEAINKNPKLAKNKRTHYVDGTIRPSASKL